MKFVTLTLILAMTVSCATDKERLHDPYGGLAVPLNKQPKKIKTETKDKR